MINLIKFFFKQIISSGIISSIILSTNIPIFLLYFLTTKSMIDDNYISLIIILNFVCFINQIDRIIKYDYDTGILEHLLVSNEINYLVYAKIMFYFLLISISMFSNYIFVCLIYGCHELNYMFLIIGILSINLIFVSILVLMASIRLYFEKNSLIISASVLPFMVGPIILIGSFFKTGEGIFVNILFGISLIILPIFIILTRFLIKDIYNS